MNLDYVNIYQTTHFIFQYLTFLYHEYIIHFHTKLDQNKSCRYPTSFFGKKNLPLSKSLRGLAKVNYELSYINSDLWYSYNKIICSVQEVLFALHQTGHVALNEPTEKAIQILSLKAPELKSSLEKALIQVTLSIGEKNFQQQFDI